MDDSTFLANLFSNDFLPGDMKAKIESLPTRSDKASYFLDHVIKPSLSGPNDSLMDKLVELIGRSEDLALKDLSEKLNNSKAPEPAHSEEGKQYSRSKLEIFKG